MSNAFDSVVHSKLVSTTYRHCDTEGELTQCQCSIPSRLPVNIGKRPLALLFQQPQIWGNNRCFFITYSSSLLYISFAQYIEGVQARWGLPRSSRPHSHSLLILVYVFSVGIHSSDLLHVWYFFHSNLHLISSFQFEVLFFLLRIYIYTSSWETYLH